jgi:hypothetical protein
LPMINTRFGALVAGSHRCAILGATTRQKIGVRVASIIPSVGGDRGIQ